MKLRLKSSGIEFRSGTIQDPYTSQWRGLSKLSADVADLARKQIVGVLLQAKLPPFNLDPELCRVIKSLKERKNILILPAGKEGPQLY